MKKIKANALNDRVLWRHERLDGLTVEVYSVKYDELEEVLKEVSKLNDVEEQEGEFFVYLANRFSNLEFKDVKEWKEVSNYATDFWSGYKKALLDTYHQALTTVTKQIETGEKLEELSE